MHSWSTRASAVFSFTCFVLLGATVFNAATHFVLKGEPNITLSHAGLYKMGHVQLSALKNSGELQPDDHGVFVHFNLDADLTPLWTWNTHEIFVMVMVEFKTSTHEKNHVVIWDQIILSKADSKFSLEKQSPDYAITDELADLSNAAVSIVVKYDVIPIAGPLLMTQTGSQRFSLPAQINQLPTETAPRRFYAPNTRPF